MKKIFAGPPYVFRAVIPLPLLFLALVLTGLAPVFMGTASAEVLLWGSDAEGGAPYVFPDPENPSRLIGFEVDLADALARELGMTARQVQTDWSSLIPALKRGDFHIAMNGIEWTPQRAREVAFSVPYYLFAQQLVVRAEDQGIRSLAMNPECILFDEPTSSLDPETVGDVLQVMRGLAEEGMTMLVATHEMSFARDVADRVVMLDEGAFIESGPPGQIFENPSQERTRTFLKRILNR